MDTGERAYEKIINYVEQQVMQGRYKKGDKLPAESEVAALLGASRNSVREGLGILDRMGAISSQQGAGNFISDNFEKTLVEVMTLMLILEEATFREISEFRYALETQALALAMEHISKKQLADIEYYMSMLEKTPEEDMKAYYDKKIHYTITAASGNRFIIDNLQALTAVMDVFIKDMRAKILSDGSNSVGLMAAHREMVEALREKNMEKGMQALKVHFEYIFEYIDGYCRLNERGDIPLGYAYNGATPEDGGYLRQTLDTIIEGNKILYPQRSIKDNLPEGYKLLRKLLASHPDKSVVFIAVGPETNRSRLLCSEADEYSPLDGKSLGAQKVKLLSVMGGLYGN